MPHLHPLRTEPALTIAAPFAFGIGAALLLDNSISLIVAIAGALIGLAATASSLTRRAGLLLIIAAAGMADYALQNETPVIPEEEHLYSGVVVSASEGSSRRNLVVNADSIDGNSMRRLTLALTLDQDVSDIDEGHRILFYAALRKPDGDKTVPDEITYADIASRSGIVATSFITATNIKRVSKDRGVISFMARQRTRLIDLLYSSSLSPDSKTFLATALLGRSDAIGSDTRQAFAKAGLSHILALSGMHVAIVAAILFWALSPIVLIAPRHVRSISIISAIWAYAFITGLGAPVVRAAVMTSLVLAADLLQRRTFPLNSLMMAALMILVVSPSQITRLGFQLSFLAIASIIAFADYLNPVAKSRNMLLRGAGAAFAMSVAAMMATALVSALHFHSLPLLFLAANMIVGPVVIPVILGGGLIIILALSAGLPYGIPALVVDDAVSFLNHTASFISRLSWATADIWALSTITVVLLLATLALIAYTLRSNSSTGGLITASIVMGLATVVAAITTGGREPQSPSGTMWRLHNSDYMDMLIPLADTLYLISDAPRSTLDSRAEELTYRMSKYMGRRGIKALIPAHDHMDRNGLIRAGSRLKIGSQRIALAGSGFAAPDSNRRGIAGTDLLILTRGYHGSLPELVNAMKPDSVYLSPGLNPRLRKRYQRELLELGIFSSEGGLFRLVRSE